LYNYDLDDGASFIGNRTAHLAQYSYLEVIASLRAVMTKRQGSMEINQTVMLQNALGFAQLSLMKSFDGSVSIVQYRVCVCYGCCGLAVYSYLVVDLSASPSPRVPSVLRGSDRQRGGATRSPEHLHPLDVRSHQKPPTRRGFLPPPRMITIDELMIITIL
jgi:hypothetical protein